MELNEAARQAIIEAYAERVVEDMDLDALVEFAMEAIMDRLEDYTDAGLVAVVANYYPDLLEGF